MKRHWDEMDEEACNQGAAFHKQLTTQIAKKGLGKVNLKTRKMHGDAFFAVQRKTVKNSFFVR
jgi:hypothetical protein